MVSPSALTPQGIVRPTDRAGELSSSDDDVDVPGSRKKRLVTTFDRFTITDEDKRRLESVESVESVEGVGSVGRVSEGGKLVHLPLQQTVGCHRHERSEADEYMANGKEETSTSHLRPPSTKKRKGVRKVTSHKALKSLSELSKRFGDIQLNKDFYDSIKQTESRCEPGEDVRDVDRQAFRDALVDVEQLIRVQHEAMLRDPEDALEPRETGVISLVALSLDVIQYFIDTGTTTSSTVTTGVTREHSLSKSTSQNVNTSEVIESPLKAKKHPRRSQSIQEGEGSIGRGPSRQRSLISNEHPKRQRKYEMDEVSSRPLVDGETFGEIGANVGDENVQGESGGEVAAPSGAPTVDVNDEDRSRSHTHASSKMQPASDAAGIVDAVDDACNALDERKDEHGDNVVEGEEGDGPNQKPIWKSSLVCADLSLNEVGSRIYAPLLSSLRAAGLVGGANRGGDGGQYENDDDSEALDSLIKIHTVAAKESQELGKTIYSTVENVYVETYGLRNAKIAQKALALVLEAFDRIVRDILAADGGETDGASDEEEDGVSKEDEDEQPGRDKGGESGRRPDPDNDQSDDEGTHG